MWVQALERHTNCHQAYHRPETTAALHADCTSRLLALQLLSSPSLNSRRRRPPQEVASEQQARDLDIPAGVNVQRAPSPEEVHRTVHDQKMTERLRQYEVSGKIGTYLSRKD